MIAVPSRPDQARKAKFIVSSVGHLGKDAGCDTDVQYIIGSRTTKKSSLTCVVEAHRGMFSAVF